jgi:hypothetical protein
MCKKDGSDASDACLKCTDGNAATACWQGEKTACEANADCVALMQCYDACAPDAVKKK